MTIMDHLIDPDTGEIDFTACVGAARQRAIKEWGRTDFPPAYYRASRQVILDRAADLRREWRRARGMGDDSTTTMTVLPDWGSAGDSYGRH